MAAVQIIRLPLGPFRVNMYIVICHRRKQAVIIDPAADPQTIIQTLDAQEAVAGCILNTHGHPDHLLANAALRQSLNIPVCMHAADSGLFADDPGIRLLEQQTGLAVDTLADRPLGDGQRLRFGSATIEVLHTPGHTPGGCCFLVDGQLFTGDTLFVGDAGRTDLKGGSLDQLIHSIETRLLPLPDTTVIWPGHDYGTTPTSTLAREKQENPYITDFILNP